MANKKGEEKKRSINKRKRETKERESGIIKNTNYTERQTQLVKVNLPNP